MRYLAITVREVRYLEWKHRYLNITSYYLFDGEKSARSDVNIGKRVSKFDTPDKGVGGDSSRVEER